ncbi:unnamed protein product, partial [Ectocarpus sp. 12 AP-2014]
PLWSPTLYLHLPQQQTLATSYKYASTLNTEQRFSTSYAALFDVLVRCQSPTLLLCGLPSSATAVAARKVATPTTPASSPAHSKIKLQLLDDDSAVGRSCPQRYPKYVSLPRITEPAKLQITTSRRSATHPQPYPLAGASSQRTQQQ